MSSCSFVQMSPDKVIEAAEKRIRTIDNTIAERRKKILEREKNSFWYRVRRDKPSDEDFAKELNSSIWNDYNTAGFYAARQRQTCNMLISLAEAARETGATVHVSAEDWDDIS